MRRKSADKTTLEAETVGYMPERFIAGYNELVRLGLKTDPGSQVFDNESGTVKKKYHQHAGGLKDEQALRFKAWVDRQLRAIGRDVQAYLNARDSTGPSPIGISGSQRREIAREIAERTELKCRGCGNYISWQWACCAWCGKRILRDGDTRNDVQAESTTGPQAAAGLLEHVPGRTGTDTPREDGAKVRLDVGSKAGTDRPPRSSDSTGQGT